MLLQLLNALLGNVVDLSTIKKTMMLLRTLRMFKLMRKFRVSGLGCCNRSPSVTFCSEYRMAAVSPTVR